MTREETKKILMGISCSYPNFKPNVPLDFMIDIWTDDLAEYTYQQVYTALKVFKTTNTSGFAPSIGQLIDIIHSVNEAPTEISEMAVWGQVMRAISNSTYNAESEFEKLDDITKAVLGSPSALRSMASNCEFNEDVEKSLFMRSYKNQLDKNKRLARMPQEVRTMIAEKKDEVLQIESR